MKEQIIIGHLSDAPRPSIAMSTESYEFDSKDYYTVMIHFYRGELGRIMAWRQRLDVTTNWAIVSATAMITFGLSSPEHSHLIFLFGNLLVLLLLVIEARRYRYYDAFRARVRMLEAHFIMPVVMHDVMLLQGDWRRVMSEDLLRPSFKITALMAILRRFRRNYFWIFLLLGCAWFVKIWIHKSDSHSLSGLFRFLTASNSLPPGVFPTLFATFYLMLLTMTVAAFVRKEAAGEFATKAMRRQKWLQ